MLKIRNIAAVIAAAVIVVSLSACTPPKPPELLAQEAEQVYTCVEGDSKVAFESSLLGLVETWQDSVTTACDGMSISEPTDKEQPNILVSSAADAATCKPFLTVPFAIDAGVVVAYFEDGTQVQFSAKSLGAVLSGKVTNWNDPLLQKDNPMIELPDLPITIFDKGDANAVDAIAQWMTRLDSGYSNTLIKPVANYEFNTDELTEGSLAILTYSAATDAGLTGAVIVNGKSAADDIVTPGGDNIKAAASQYVVKHSASGTSVKLDPTKRVTPPLGSDVAPAPYQAVFVINLALCGEESQVNRAVAKFLLRQDSQGAISTSSVISLPEEIRIEALLDVSKGLPTPSVSPAKQ